MTHYAFLLSLLLAPALARAAEPFAPGKDGWVSLFDGSDKARWDAAKGAQWELKDGAFVGTKGEVLNYWHWVDFELVGECRSEGALRFRLSLAPLPDQPGYWLDLADGTIRAAEGRVVAKGSGAKADGWRQVRLVVSKRTFTVFFDGKQVAAGKDDACPAMGQIGLAAADKPLELKLLRIRPLNREQHVNVPAPDTACFVCHANFEREKIAREHVKHDPDGAEDDHLKPANRRPPRNGCAGCHGPSLAHRSDEDNVTAPDVLYLHGEVEAACLQCHLPHKNETKRKDGEGPPPPNAVCTDCHGSHRARN